MDKKILIILLCGLLAVWPCIPALAAEEETTAEWNIFDDVETVARQTVTSIEQGTEIISKYIAMTTDYTGDIFDNLVNEAVNLWQSSGVALTLDYITNGGALDYIVDIGELGQLISEYINSNYEPSETPEIRRGTYWYQLPNSRFGVRYILKSGGPIWACNVNGQTMLLCLVSSRWSTTSSDYGYQMNLNSTYNGTRYGYMVYPSTFGGEYQAISNSEAIADFFAGIQFEDAGDSATSTPTQYITSAGIGSVNWSNVSSDESNTYNNIENVYNYITNTGQQLDEASVDQMAAEGATLANIDYSVPNAAYDYSFISVAFAVLPDEFKGIILLGIVLLVCSILFGFGHGGVK